MRTFAQKQNQPQRQTSFNRRRSGTSISAAGHEIRAAMHLRRTLGNQSVLRLLRANADGLELGSMSPATTRFAHDFSRLPVFAKDLGQIQTKLAVNVPGDIFEREADRVADQVMHMPAPQMRRPSAGGGKCPRCQAEQPGQAHEHLQIQRVQATDAVQTAAPPVVHQVLNSLGQPLDPVVRAFMEPRFGRDFSHVRVHTGGQASKSARTLKALAYTVGRDIVLDDELNATDTAPGHHLLAHELAHVIQQEGTAGASTSHIAVQRKLALESAAETKDFVFFLTAKDAANFKVHNKSKPLDVTIKTAPTSPEDPFRFNILKKIINDPSETLVVKKVPMDEELDILEVFDISQDTLSTSISTIKPENPVTLASLKAAGITIPSKTLALNDPDTPFCTRSYHESWIRYHEPDALAHEFGHAFLLFSGAPWLHGTKAKVPASAGVTDPFGATFTGTADEYFGFVDEVTYLGYYPGSSDPEVNQLHTSPTRIQVWKEPTPDPEKWVDSKPMSWLDYKKKWPDAQIKLEVDKKGVKHVSVCNPAFSGELCLP